MDISGLRAMGLNTEKALELVGNSEEIYQKILNTYYNNIEKKIEEIETAYNAKDIKKYTVYVHALKSASRQIGAEELGEKAYHLELCGKEENIDEINAKTEELIKEYRIIGKTIEPFITEREAPVSVTVKKVSPALLKAKLLKLKQSAKKFDMDTARKTLTEIEGYEYTPQQQTFLQGISENVKAYKYDAVAENADNLLKSL